MRGRFFRKGLAFVVLAAAVLAALTFIVMSLWNELIPALFAGPHVSFWQAAGLLVLCRILFVGFPRGHHYGWGHRRWYRAWRHMSPEEREKIRTGIARWHDMSHEERHELRSKMREQYGWCGRRTQVDGTRGETSTSGREDTTAPGSGPSV